MDRERQWLLGSIKTLLLPEFIQRGFVVTPLEDGEMKSLQPFGRLRREKSGCIDLIEVKIHKYHYAFSVGLGRIPPEGAIRDGRHLERGLVKKLGDIDMHYWTSPKFSLGYGFFSVWHWPWKKVTVVDYEDLVKRFIKIIPEIELALHEGKRGPHIKLVDLRGRLENKKGSDSNKKGSDSN